MDILKLAKALQKEIWNVVDQYDNGKDIAPATIATLQDKANTIMCKACNKPQQRRLNSILSNALHSLKSLH